MKKIIYIVVLALLALVLWGAVKNKKTVINEPIKIGIIAPLTGPVADYGEQIQKGTLSLGASTKVVFIFEDDKCDAKEAVTAFNKLTDFDKADFIIGPACGSPQEAIVPLVKTKGTVVMVPAAASNDLYANSGSNLFNVQYSLEDESRFIGDKLNSLNYKTVALVHYKNAFSESHTKGFKESYKGNIVDIVVNDQSSDIASQMLKIKSAKVDAVYSPDISFFFANGLVKLRQIGVKAPVYSTYVAELPAVRTLVPGVIYSYPSNLTGDNGATFELAKQSAQIMSDYVTQCSGDASCVKSKLQSSGNFNEFGVFKRSLILKQIKEAEAVELK